jgi:arylsulfatase A-like enzyme
MQRGRTPALVSTVDLMPTILDIAGVRPPDHLQGVSLKKILLGQAGSAGGYVVSESVGVGGQLGSGHRMVRTKQWKYILSDENEEALFDLNKDPFELKNLINRKSYAPQLVQLRIYYCRWREYVRDKKQLPPC